MPGKHRGKVDPAVDDEAGEDPADLDDGSDVADDLPEDFDAAPAEEVEQSAAAARTWSEAEIHPVELALPKGVGFTLRHYRTADADLDDIDLDDTDLDDTDDVDTDEADADDSGGRGADEEAVEEAVFLATDGRLHLFRSAEGLVEFVRSDAPHDLTGVDGWDDVVRELQPIHVDPDDEDSYELDLVVENLRGGHDAWDPDLLIAAGEVARDLAFALKLNDVLAALAPGSPLDDLDEALRNGGLFARRRMKKISAEQAALAWRSVIGKISAAVEWHD